MKPTTAFRKFQPIRPTGVKSRGINGTFWKADGKSTHSLHRWVEHLNRKFNWSSASTSISLAERGINYIGTLDSPNELEVSSALPLKRQEVSRLYSKIQVEELKHVFLN